MALFVAKVAKSFLKQRKEVLCIHRYFNEDYFNEENKSTQIRDVSIDNLIGTEGKIPLGGMRYVTVQTFMAKKYVDIREYFEKDGEIKPTTKGITLRMAEWRELKENLDFIEEKIQTFEFEKDTF